MDEKELLESLLAKCYRYLSYRPRSEMEMIRYLTTKAKKNKKIDERIIKMAIQSLKDQSLINDSEFVAWWVDSRSYFRPKGAFGLKIELLGKGISKEIIETYFQDNKLDEVDLASKVLEKKLKTIKAYNKEERFQKSINLLLRRGFTYGVAKKAFEDCIKKE